MTGTGKTMQEECFWQREDGPYCINGEVREYWCYYCCSGGACIVQTCAWYTTGSCPASSPLPAGDAAVGPAGGIV